MRTTRLVALIVLLGCAATGAALAAPPVIERVDVERVRIARNEAPRLEEAMVRVRVRDADGAADIASVTITRPWFDEYAIAPGASGAAQWTQEGPLTVQVALRDPWAAEGTYSIVVTDLEGGSDSLDAPSASLIPDSSAGCGVGFYGGSTTTETTPTITWHSNLVGATATVKVSQLSGGLIWQYQPPGGSSTASVRYNADGTATIPQLAAGSAYLLEVEDRLCVDAGVADPRVYLWQVAQLSRTFAVCSSQPTVVSVRVDRRVETVDTGWRFRSEKAAVIAGDADGIYDLASFSVTDPAGRTATTRGFSQYGEYGMKGTCEFPETIEPPAPGQYTVVATDQAGHTGTMTFSIEAQPPGLDVVAPAMDSVISEVQPTFRWSDESGSEITSLWLVEEGGTFVWAHRVIGRQEAAFNFDGTALQAELQPGYTYLWTMGSWAEQATNDVRATAAADQLTWGRFTVEGAAQISPELAGKLAYGAYSSWNDPGLTRVYGPDAGLPEWLGPVGAEHVDWSPDGTRVVLTNGGLLQVYTPSASEVTEIAGQEGWDCRWSPDGQRVVYSRESLIGSAREIWVSQADGANAHQVVLDLYGGARFPTWSPDGRWIAYRRNASSPGIGLWLVQPDGSDDHPLTASGVIGHPGYQVDWLNEAGWSPDGVRLVMAFSAAAPAMPALSGIGVISRDGGMVKPVFLPPDGVVCCAAPQSPQWSPDGTRIVFSSGHHLDPDPRWASGRFEPGVELWIINADGSGQPTRLTYDNSYNNYVSWWAPPIFSDVVRGFWAISAISACHEAGIVGGYPDGTYRPAVAVTRDQMATYISRALAGGDEYVPTGSAQATFPDVLADHWAYRYVEYASANHVVAGYPDGLYHPADVVDRGQMAVLVARAIAEPTGDDGLVAFTPPATPSFPDVPADFWAYKYVEYIAQESIGVTQGYPDGGYHPEYPCTRDQMAMYVAQAFKLPV